ncbi:MAG: response regulator transcription factor [Clostridia bacterium]|nr:response regulator transcription factor [Clostridia bacterium]
MAHILIIEDDRAIARIEKDYLEMSGFSVTLAEDGEAGCRTALSGQFDLILLDVMLPGMDGFTVLQTLRQRLDVPILLVTARTEDPDKIRGLGLGADDYIEKPFSPGVLVARIRANLNQYARLKQGGPGQLLQAGPLTLDPPARRVFLEGREIALKNKEYELLLFFMRNPGTVFDRETLYERVWGLEALGDNATVAVHINRLREKLGEHFIQTVRGAGYRFSGES